MSKCYIVAAGDFSCADKKVINDVSSRKIPLRASLIAVDGGYDYILDADASPDLLIGDFDSIEADVNSVSKKTRIVTLEREKDDTDMLAAIKLAMLDGFRIFYIFGATSMTNIEHTLGNVQLLSYLAKRDAQGFLYTEDSVVTLIKNSSVSFVDSLEGRLSILSHTDVSTGVTLKNLKYELENGKLTNDFPLGISNEFIGKAGTVSVEDGELLIVFPRTKTKENEELNSESEENANSETQDREDESSITETE